MQIPIEVVLGPVGALGLALLWIWDLRQQNRKLTERLDGIVDELRRAISKADAK